MRLTAQYVLLANRSATTSSEVQAATATRQKASTSKSTSSQPCPANQACPCCGKSGHYARDCPTSCSVCKHRSCPGNFGSRCVISVSAFP
ncbi:hypothetical protein INO08_15225, partial [Staphylococcus aureus]|nr:hypothetical protein [Staphylococcus aureus]